MVQKTQEAYPRRVVLIFGIYANFRDVRSRIHFGNVEGRGAIAAWISDYDKVRVNSVAHFAIVEIFVNAVKIAVQRERVGPFIFDRTLEIGGRPGSFMADE